MSVIRFFNGRHKTIIIFGMIRINLHGSRLVAKAVRVCFLLEQIESKGIKGRWEISGRS